DYYCDSWDRSGTGLF
nr:immunoglobulin light chain junction region [Macaca mulatta]MOY04975.1 immunoglobulin light chain junction region [Macaca mulatta]MOY05029.1 immunoglobulin light chain junction region [Macaca mulatta]MOY05714.1 immunoglobulin light chain junction region [Macaca mulatta]MOY05929.1 immunoglobulin light chain junction region [Macaca mulatta]